MIRLPHAQPSLPALKTIWRPPLWKNENVDNFSLNQWMVPAAVRSGKKDKKEGVQCTADALILEQREDTWKSSFDVDFFCCYFTIGIHFSIAVFIGHSFYTKHTKQKVLCQNVCKCFKTFQKHQGIRNRYCTLKVELYFFMYRRLFQRIFSPTFISHTSRNSS